MNTIYYISAYLILVNLIAFAVMGIDKNKAKRHKFRIPEAVLFILAIIGGSIGSIGGMYTFRHKTKHASFVFGMPFILILQVAAILWLWLSSIEIAFL